MTQKTRQAATSRSAATTPRTSGRLRRAGGPGMATPAAAGLPDRWHARRPRRRGGGARTGRGTATPGRCRPPSGPAAGPAGRGGGAGAARRAFEDLVVDRREQLTGLPLGLQGRARRREQNRERTGAATPACGSREIMGGAGGGASDGAAQSRRRASRISAGCEGVRPGRAASSAPGPAAGPRRSRARSSGREATAPPGIAEAPP